MVCKLMKKGVLGAAIGAGALALLFGTSAKYYAHTAYHQVRNTARQNVPVQYDIDKARQQVAELEPAIHNNIEQIAKAEVEIEYLDREIATTKANLEAQGKKLVALREHLGDGHLKLASGVSYSPDEVKGEMARQLDHYRTVKAILADKEETLNLRKKSLIAFRDQNAQMRDAKRALVTQIEAIETRLRQIEATQAANEFTFDDSALARARKTVAELSKRVEVIQRVSEHEGRYTDIHAPVLLDPTRDIVSEVDAEFSHVDKPASGDKSL